MDDVKRHDAAPEPRSPEEAAREFLRVHGEFEPVPFDGHGRGRRKWWIAVLAVAAAGAVAAAAVILRPAHSAPNAPPHRNGSTSTTSPANAGATRAQAELDQRAARAGCTPSRQVSPTASAPNVFRTHTLYSATVTTTAGTFQIALAILPVVKAVNNFIYLAEKGYYNCDSFSRVIPGDLVQTNIPRGVSSRATGFVVHGGQPVASGNPADQYPLGSVAVAMGPSNANSTAWFVVVGTQGEALPDNYVILGNVYTGMDVVQSIAGQGSASGKPLLVQRILSVTIQKRSAV